jgi:putative tricarboxylic transport membrane protein
LPYGLGTLSSPSTGFLPFLAGLAISSFACVGIIHATLRRGQGVGWKPKMKGLRWQKALIVFCSLLVYVLLLKILGFSLCTTLFVGFLMRAIQPQRWTVVFIGAVATAIIAFTVFELWLQAQLPRGPWGF